MNAVQFIEEEKVEPFNDLVPLRRCFYLLRAMPFTASLTMYSAATAW